MSLLLRITFEHFSEISYFKLMLWGPFLSYLLYEAFPWFCFTGNYLPLYVLFSVCAWVSLVGWVRGHWDMYKINYMRLSKTVLNLPLGLSLSLAQPASWLLSYLLLVTEPGHSLPLSLHLGGATKQTSLWWKMEEVIQVCLGLVHGNIPPMALLVFYHWSSLGRKQNCHHLRSLNHCMQQGPTNGWYQ